MTREEKINFISSYDLLLEAVFNNGFNTPQAIELEGILKDIFDYNKNATRKSLLSNFLVLWSRQNNKGIPKFAFKEKINIDKVRSAISNEAIQHHPNANGELITWQSKKFQRQPFTTQGKPTISIDKIIILPKEVAFNREYREKKIWDFITHKNTSILSK